MSQPAPIGGKAAIAKVWVGRETLRKVLEVRSYGLDRIVALGSLSKLYCDIAKIQMDWRCGSASRLLT